jgi:hypothetical protein
MRAAPKRRQTAAVLMRIIFGSLTVILYALRLNQQRFLWGTNAVVCWNDTVALFDAARSWLNDPVLSAIFG